jgi:hypothetical protein
MFFFFFFFFLSYCATRGLRMYWGTFAQEREAIAYCTKPGHGARVMPAGTIQVCDCLFLKTQT